MIHQRLLLVTCATPHIKYNISSALINSKLCMQQTTKYLTLTSILVGILQPVYSKLRILFSTDEGKRTNYDPG